MRPDLRPLLASFALFAVVATLLSGCTFQQDRVDEITPDLIVGEWRAEVDGHTIDLIVESDGSLTFENMPPEALNVEGDEFQWEQAIATTSGTWQLAPAGTDMCCGDPWFWITLPNQVGDPRWSSFSTQLFVEGIEPNIQLERHWNGESDPPISFERVDASS